MPRTPGHVQSWKVLGARLLAQLDSYNADRAHSVHVPDHCSQEPGSVDNGRYSLVHQWMRFDEIQGIIWELIRCYIFF